MTDSTNSSQNVATKDIRIEPAAFFVAVPLYQTSHFNIEEDRAVLDVVKFNGTLEFHCLHCEQTVIFISEVAERRRRIPGNINGSSQEKEYVSHDLHVTKFNCSRNFNHVVRFLFLVERDHTKGEIRLTKIGQYPSLADLTAGELRKYRKILSPADFGEFNRAIGLATHGIGIGSFVYLRRIFERLVEEAHQFARTDSGWDEDIYFKSRMEEKIKLLAAHLPPFLVQNWQIYSILSKGIHELSEEDCKMHFDILKGGIELILDQKIEEQQRQQKAINLQKSIQKIADSIR